MNGYVVTIYQKIPMNENIIIFRRAGVVKNVDIKTHNDMDEITFYNDNQERITLESMDSEYVMVSDDQFCYGYPMLLEDLNNMYDVKTEAELIDKYSNDISQVINIGYYDSENDVMKIIVTNEEMLKKQDQDNLFNYFTVEYQSNDLQKVVFQLSDFKKMINLLKKDKIKTLKEKLLKLDENVDKAVQQVYEVNKEKENNQKMDTDINTTLDKLNNLIGLNNVKEEVYKLTKYLEFRNKVKNNLKLENLNLHMFFTGNPGTGKTTVARVIGELLYKMGYLKNNNIIEITPKDLIAGYVGQTAIKTGELLKKNKGGLIFIDEAYILAGEANRFAGEALVEIIKELEKNETVFIFAGYKDEMQHFMEINPGLTSRIGYYLEYNDYSKEELYQIFEKKVTQMGFIINEKLKEKIMTNLETAVNNDNFGNGRYIDKLINKLILEHSINTDKYKRKKELITLTEKDFNQRVEDTLIFKQKTKTIGFI